VNSSVLQAAGEENSNVEVKEESSIEAMKRSPGATAI
jgi:hypothetical protein